MPDALSTDEATSAVLVGNPSDGWKVYGPFRDHDEAAAWASKLTLEADTWVSTLLSPNKESPNPEIFDCGTHGSLIPWIRGRVTVDFNDVLGSNLEGFLDLVSEKLTGTELLADIRTRVVRVVDAGTLEIEVEGDPGAIEDGPVYELVKQFRKSKGDTDGSE